METQLHCDSMKHSCDTGHRSFSIDSLLSNNYKKTSGKSDSVVEDVTNEFQRTPFQYLKYEIEGLAKDAKWKDCLQTSIDQKDILETDAEFSHKHFSIMKHIKNMDYLPWISTTNIFSHRELYDETISRSTNFHETEGIGFTPYSRLSLPFVYSSWLPTASVVAKPNENMGTNFLYNGFSRTSPKEENTDSEDSKSDSSRISDTPKDFSCTKQHISGEYFIL